MAKQKPGAHRQVSKMGFRNDQFFTVWGVQHFAPHYESDQYTSTELRRIADYMDKLSTGLRKEK